MTQTISNELVDSCRCVPIHRLVGNPHLQRKVKIHCPFHPENTPSCVLFPGGGFKCFGCGARGNSVDFVMKLSDKTDDREKFKEALEELSKFV